MDFQPTKAIYLQISDLMMERILSGEWQAEARIPSVRETAVALEVNPNTVMRSYNYLDEKEIIYNKRGIGYFVSADGYHKTLALKRQIFIQQELPQFFHTLQLLHISISEVKKKYQEQYHETK